MRIWKQLVFACVAALSIVGSAHAITWDKAPGKTNDTASLQHGAKIFANYCLNCHSAAFMRFNRLQDIGLTNEQIEGNLMFTTEKVGDTMVASIDPLQAKAWFGTNPPDLTVVARSRAGAGGSGADYLYTLFRTYFRNDTTPTGWDNLAFPNIGMPHPLWELEGERKPLFETIVKYGEEQQVFTGRWEDVKSGTLSRQDYDQTVADLVNFLQWMGEPIQNKRRAIGVWVLLFLGVFTFMAWRLNAAYWKDVE